MNGYCRLTKHIPDGNMVAVYQNNPTFFIGDMFEQGTRIFCRSSQLNKLGTAHTANFCTYIEIILR